MGNLLVYIGKPKQAIDQLKEAIRLNPIPRVTGTFNISGGPMKKPACLRRL